MEQSNEDLPLHAYKEANANANPNAPAAAEPLEVHFHATDPENPYHMSARRKWSIVLLVASTTLCYTCTSSLYTSTYAQITREFQCSQLIATLGLSLFIGGLGLGPMVLAPLSEFYGRKPIYIVSLFLFTVWIVPCALARNIETMLVARFVSGFVGAAFTSVAGGTVGDLFTKNTLLAPMMVYSASPLYVGQSSSRRCLTAVVTDFKGSIGASLGPVVGGFINQNLSW